MEKNTCAFTGHRPKSFPWKYNETATDCVLLKEVLAEQIKILADRGVTDFFSGMAQGVDLWSSQIVLDLQKKNPALKLHCVLTNRNEILISAMANHSSGRLCVKLSATPLWNRP